MGEVALLRIGLALVGRHEILCCAVVEFVFLKRGLKEPDPLCAIRRCLAAVIGVWNGYDLRPDAKNPGKCSGPAFLSSPFHMGSGRAFRH